MLVWCRSKTQVGGPGWWPVREPVVKESVVEVSVAPAPKRCTANRIDRQVPRVKRHARCPLSPLCRPYGAAVQTRARFRLHGAGQCQRQFAGARRCERGLPFRRIGVANGVVFRAQSGKGHTQAEQREPQNGPKVRKANASRTHPAWSFGLLGPACSSVLCVLRACQVWAQGGQPLRETHSTLHIVTHIQRHTLCRLWGTL